RDGTEDDWIFNYNRLGQGNQPGDEVEMPSDDERGNDEEGEEDEEREYEGEEDEKGEYEGEEDGYDNEYHSHYEQGTNYINVFSYSSVYRDYVQAYKEKHESEICVMVESTFVKIWESLIPSFQFMSSKSNLCENCKTMKMDIQYTIQHEKKLDFTENYLNHLKHAQQDKNNPKPSESQTLYKTFKEVAHIAYDWTQNVQIPYFSQQIGPLFFKNPRKINYIINEGEMPDDGKQGKGSDKVNTVDDIVSIVNRSTANSFNVAQPQPQRYLNGEGF
ncbi:hypothetical protein RhiirC2_796754, partial [Rhizophagus irregularis]